jgi:hypothetical protein
VSTRRRIPHAFMQARTGPLNESPERLRNDPLAQAARGILILAFVLGSLGADAAVSSGQGSAGHATGRQPEVGIHLAASVEGISGGRITPLPWML